MTLMGLTRAPNAQFEGSARYQGTDLVTAGDNELRAIRGAEIAMIFQDPMTSLNPVIKIGDQIIEQIREHLGISGQQARERTIELLERVGIPARARPGRFVPVRVLGRHAPAGDDRDGALVRPEHPDRRRADHRPRRDHPGADPRARPRPARVDRRGGDPRDPRPRRRGGHRRPDSGHVRRAHRRGGHARPDLLRPAAPVHLGAAGVDHPRGPARGRSACPRSPACRRRSPTGPRAATSGLAARTSSTNA